MWQEINKQELDERTTMITTEAEYAGKRLIKTITLYRNRDGKQSVCSDTAVLDIPAKQERKLKEKA